MNITVVGTGYVGIITAAVLADFGNHVWGIDIDPQRVKDLRSGKSPIYEPGLNDLLQKGVNAKRLEFTTKYSQGLEDSGVVFVCVGTPQDKNGKVDTKYVFACVESIVQTAKQPMIIVLKSTVPPGIHRELQKLVAKYTKLKMEFASMPEFLREGSALQDTLTPPRIVIGTKSKKTEETLLKLHEPIPGERILTDIISAQMVKYASNAFLATKISFANARARISDSLGANVTDVMLGMGLDPRIGKSFLYPGLGFGGSCFPKDIKGIYYLALENGYDFDLIKMVDQINDTQVDYLLQKTSKFINSWKGKKVGFLGLAFKPETDDMREARSVVLAEKLLAMGAEIVAYDPVATKTAQKELGKKIGYAKNVDEVLVDADVVFLVTEWNEFHKLDLKKVKNLMHGNLLVDGRNIYDSRLVREAGLEYIGVGRD